MEIQAALADPEDVGGIDKAYVEAGLEEGGLDLDTINEEAAESIPPLTGSDLDDLAEKAGTPLEEIKLGNQRFVRLVDVLPPCPARGSFDVERIRDSLYFFS